MCRGGIELGLQLVLSFSPSERVEQLPELGDSHLIDTRTRSVCLADWTGVKVRINRGLLIGLVIVAFLIIQSNFKRLLRLIYQMYSKCFILFLFFNHFRCNGRLTIFF